MATVSVSARYADGVSTIDIPDAYVGSEIWLLFNGQVWTDGVFTVSGSVLTVSGIDLTDEFIQLSAVDLSVSSNDLNAPASDSALSVISDKLDALLTASGSASTAITPSIKASDVVLGSVNSAAIQALSGRRQRLGMNAQTGRLLTGIEHLEQSIADILRTALRSRVMRRAYGGDLYLHKDKNLTPARTVMIYASVATAIEKDEPRVVVDRIWLDQGEAAGLEGGVVMIVLSWRIAAAYQVDFLSDLSSVAANDGYFTQRVVVGL